MIGQLRAKKIIEKWNLETAPPFIIISGGKGYGKKLLGKYIAEHLGIQQVVSDIRVDDVREVLMNAYKQTEPILYTFYDVDKMSLAAKNALLKATEEPPKKARFLLTVQDKDNLLPTLRSRAYTLTMNPYTPREILEYCDIRNYKLTDSEEQLIPEICNCPGEVDIIMRYDIDTFTQYVETVLDNIGVVNGSNAFKIGSKLSFKDDEPGWDINLFMSVLKEVCRRRLVASKDVRYAESIGITVKYQSQLAINGINKSATFDMWILQMRGIWVE